MKKSPLTTADKQLVDAAIAAAKKPITQLWDEKAPPLVSAALRLDNGKIITGSVLLADVGGLNVCAESVAIAEASRHVGRKIKAVVAVYHDPGLQPKIISPCGRCRELITDYAKDGYVILRDPGTRKTFKVKSGELLPFKYADYWHHRELL